MKMFRGIFSRFLMLKRVDNVNNKTTIYVVLYTFSSKVYLELAIFVGTLRNRRIVLDICKRKIGDSQNKYMEEDSATYYWQHVSS